MSAFLSLLIILAGVGLVIFYFFACFAFGSIAQEKGYDERYGFCVCLCIFLGIVGFLYVIALPDKKAHGSMGENGRYAEKENEELPTL